MSHDAFMQPCSVICVAFVVLYGCCLVDEPVLGVLLGVLGTSHRYVDDEQICVHMHIN